MRFAKGRTQDSSVAQQVQAGVASASLQQSQLLQQQTEQVTAIQHSPQQQLQRKQLQGLVSQQISLEEEPMQGKFAVVQQAGLEEEEPMQGKFAVVQQAGLEEEEPLQGKFAVVQQAGLEEEPLQGKFEPAVVSQRQADTSINNTGMPDQLKSGIESLSGYAMDDVKVHYNSAKPATMQAHAYAQGTDIHIAPGQEKHLPHEAWHVVQQKQGRVKPTRQLKGKVNINDDAGLEQEADIMGELAKSNGSANGKNSIQREAISFSNDQYPIQRVMSLAEFQAATPKSMFNPRTQGGIQQIDIALSAYIGARTAANANALINTLNGYIGGNHHAGRIVVATNLLTRVQNERDLLVAMGDAHAFLVDGLILQTNAVPFNNLRQLALAVPGAAATQIPAIINEVGPANIADPNLILLLGSMGAGSMNVLTDMISKCGGVAQLGNLYTVVNRHPGQGDLAHDLTKEAAGAAGTFNRLAGEIPAFSQAPAGAVPAGLALVIAAYNNTLAAAPLANFAALVNQADAAHTAATNLRAAIHGGGGINLGLLNNIMNNPVNGIIALQGIAAGPAAPTAPQIANANALRGMIATPLNNQVTAAIGGVPSPLLAVDWGNFITAVGAINIANTSLTNAAAAPMLAGVNWAHFLTRHTANHFNFGEIKPDNTQWDVTWGAGAGVQVLAQLAGVIGGLAAAENWLLPGIPIPNQAVPGGGSAQIAGLAGVAPNTLNIGQFFPENSPANNHYDHPASTMRAILKVI
ncbi:eCIS core domain-containing protein [Rheinheimera gaetbuli]